MQRIWEDRMTSRFFPGNSAHGQAFVHLDDVVDAIARCVDRRGELPEEVAILIGEDRTLSYDELQHAFAHYLHGDDESFETRPIPETIAKVGAWVQDKLPRESFIKPWMIPHADDHYELDVTRARELLGWEPRHALRDALPKMAEALLRDPAGWYREHDLKPPEESASTESRKT
jgi:nucleoside-diphosphate-sugar epimerase